VNVSTEQAGFAPDPGNNDNSVNYLRRLKAQIEAETPGTPPVHTVVVGQNPSPQRERRRSPLKREVPRP
jgi:hypothetical protein